MIANNLNNVSSRTQQNAQLENQLLRSSGNHGQGGLHNNVHRNQPSSGLTHQQQRPRPPQPLGSGISPQRISNPQVPARQGHVSNGYQNGGSRSSNHATTSASQVPPPPPPPPVLPKGWKREEIMRTRGITAGLTDVVYVPLPNSELSQGVVGKKFRSKLELQRHLGTKFDVSLLDFRRGKASQVSWRKQRRIKSIQMNPSNYQVASKYDTFLNLPARQTVSIFKQPVVTLTNHKNDPTPNHVRNGPNTKSDKPMPTQLFWELRFKGIRPVDASLLNIDGLSHEFESAKLSKFDNFDLPNERAFMSIAASWYINQNKILVGQSKDFEKNSRIFVDREQPLIPAISVKEEEIKAQEERIQELRKQIKQALQDLEEMETLDGIDALALSQEKAISTMDEAKNPFGEMSVDQIKTEQPIQIDS